MKDLPDLQITCNISLYKVNPEFVEDAIISRGKKNVNVFFDADQMTITITPTDFLDLHLTAILLHSNKAFDLKFLLQDGRILSYDEYKQLPEGSLKGH